MHPLASVLIAVQQFEAAQLDTVFHLQFGVFVQERVQLGVFLQGHLVQQFLGGFHQNT